MSEPSRTLWLNAEAPPKPPLGVACNGCGVCCAWAPCPIGVVVSRSRQGPCRALRWNAQAGHYRCGVLADATAAVAQAEDRPGCLSALHRGWARARQAWLRRRIAAGAGCDSSLEPAGQAARPE